MLTGDLGMMSVPTDWREQVEERGLSEELIKLMAACIASKAAKRPASAIGLAEQLKPCGDDLRCGMKSVPQAELSERVAVSLGTNITMQFAWCPPGTFLMGSPPSEAERSDDESRHRVTLTRGFYLGIHPVTQAQWQAVMGSNPSGFKGEDHP